MKDIFMPQTILYAVRQNYWLLSARKVVRQITTKCITCYRSAPNIALTIMGNLFKSRITITSRAFERCGVNYAGPLDYKDTPRRNAKQIKCYMATFASTQSRRRIS